jgi:glycosyltransferase involved in cell wall biosynthesis
MKVLFLLPRFHTNLFHAIAALRERGHDVMLCCVEQGPIEDYRSLVPEILMPDDLRWAAVFRRLRIFGPDIVIIRQTEGRWRRFAYLARLLGIPAVGYDQRALDRPRSIQRRLRDWFRGRPILRFTPVLGERLAARRDAQAFYLPFPVRAEDGTRSYVPDGVVRVLCVGKLNQPRKQHFLLIEALEALAPRHRFALTLIGSSAYRASGGTPAYYERLCEYARSGALASVTALRADVPFREMPAVYRAHDICVLPSRSEPLGTAPLEAMAHGCVPVLSDECGSAGYVDPGETGLIFRADDGQALRELLDGLLGDPARIARMGRAAAARAADEFSPSRFIERFEALCTRAGVRERRA